MKTFAFVLLMSLLVVGLVGCSGSSPLETTDTMAPEPGLVSIVEPVTLVAEVIGDKEGEPSVAIIGTQAFAVPPAAVPHLRNLAAGTLLKVDPVLLAAWGSADVPTGLIDGCGPAAVATEKKVVLPVTTGKETTARTFVSRRHICVYYAKETQQAAEYTPRPTELTGSHPEL